MRFSLTAVERLLFAIAAIITVLTGLAELAEKLL